MSSRVIEVAGTNLQSVQLTGTYKKLEVVVTPAKDFFIEDVNFYLYRSSTAGFTGNLKVTIDNDPTTETLVDVASLPTTLNGRMLCTIPVNREFNEDGFHKFTIESDSDLDTFLVANSSAYVRVGSFNQQDTVYTGLNSVSLWRNTSPVPLVQMEFFMMGELILPKFVVCNCCGYDTKEVGVNCPLCGWNGNDTVTEV